MRRAQRLVAAASFAGDEYPGLRIRRLYSGQCCLGRHPLGETHVVAGPEADATVCGRPRASFPHELAQTVRLSSASVCDDCRSAPG